jgi:hypothetical protein
MKPTTRILALAVLAAAAGTSSAEIFRCQSREGTTYQQVPCPEEAIADTINIAASYPDYMAERDRLAQREAAMDARLLRRLQIESAERIARDNRAALEAQAERDRLAQLAAQAGPAYIVPFAMRAPRHPRHAWSAGVR